MGLMPREQTAPVRNAQPEVAKRRVKLEKFQKYIDLLEQDSDGMAFLASRGIKLETAKAWHLGLKVEDDGTKWLMFPYISNDEICDVKYRRLDEKRFRRMGGGDSVLYGEHQLKSVDSNVIYLVEGEIDAMTLWQQGYRPVVSTTTGAGSFKPRWYDLITAAKPNQLILCYDSDVAGQNGALKVAKKFEDFPVLNVVLPDAKDVNEYFIAQGHTNDEFDELIKESQPLEMEYAISMGEAFNRLEEELFLGSEGVNGLPSQFTSLNEMIAGGYWNGFLVTVSGQAGVGKTSFVLQELLGYAKDSIPSYLMCLEMPETMVLRKCIQHIHHVDMNAIKLDHVQRIRPEMEKWPFFFGYKSGQNFDELEKAIRSAVKRYDLRCMAFDNINYFIRSSTNQAGEIGIVTKRLKEIAVDLNIPIIMIAQPRKLKTREDGTTNMMTMDDLKDSSSISQDSDVVMMLYRMRRKTNVQAHGTGTTHGAYSPYAILRVDKSRYSSGGETTLYFDGAISTFRELTLEERQRVSSNGDD
jgi:5S rRNA maturation endonuclease (ribonuclease M5)/archaellum biogenesis ATPase FlaH